MPWPLLFARTLCTSCGSGSGRSRESGLFRFCREFVLHVEIVGGAEEIIGFVGSLGMLRGLEQELHTHELEEVARRVLGERKVPLIFGYRVRIGVK